MAENEQNVGGGSQQQEAGEQLRQQQQAGGEPASAAEAVRLAEERGESTAHLTLPMQSNSPHYDERGVLRDGEMRRRFEAVRETALTTNPEETAVATPDGETLKEARERFGGEAQQQRTPPTGEGAAGVTAGAEAGASAPAVSPLRKERLERSVRLAAEQREQEDAAQKARIRMVDALRSRASEAATQDAAATGAIAPASNPGQRPLPPTPPSKEEQAASTDEQASDPASFSHGGSGEGGTPVVEEPRNGPEGSEGKGVAAHTTRDVEAGEVRPPETATGASTPPLDAGATAATEETGGATDSAASTEGGRRRPSQK
jgi:hypothetical protein